MFLFLILARRSVNPSLIKKVKYEKNIGCIPPTGMVPPCPEGYATARRCNTCTSCACQGFEGYGCIKKCGSYYSCAEICEKY